jgi:hypothetical protein
MSLAIEPSPLPSPVGFVVKKGLEQLVAHVSETGILQVWCIPPRGMFGKGRTSRF